MINKKDKILFICAFGQSRSRYFAEQMMLKGYMSLFCGYDKEADIKYNKELMLWATKIVILDNYFLQTSEGKYLEKDHIKFYIDDEPSSHNERFEDFFNIHLNKVICEVCKKQIKKMEDAIDHYDCFDKKEN